MEGSNLTLKLGKNTTKDKKNGLSIHVGVTKQSMLFAILFYVDSVSTFIQSHQCNLEVGLSQYHDNLCWSKCHLLTSFMQRFGRERIKFCYTQVPI